MSVNIKKYYYYEEKVLYWVNVLVQMAFTAKNDE